MSVDTVSEFTLEVDDADLDRLFDRPAGVGAVGETVAPSAELVAVTNRIASQFVSVLHSTASRLFAVKDPSAALAQLRATLDALERLAHASGDPAHVALLAEARADAHRFAASPDGRQRDVFLARLRAWLPRYADHLGADGDMLRALVRFDPESVPLFGELREIPGIGRRRLERLFCAGLHSVEVVSGADPLEVAQVTGLPRALAADVVSRARAWSEEHRRRTVLELRGKLAAFSRIVAAIDPVSAPELHALARVTLDEMRGMVAAWSAVEDT